MEREKIKKTPFEDDVIFDESGDENFLILHNDDYHTFDFVIENLIDICKHDEQQANQCALLVHTKGKCDVKKGDYEYLHPMKQALAEKGLTVTID